MAKKIQIDFFRNQLLPWQEKILDEFDQSSYKIIAAGRKARKTTFVVNQLMIKAMSDKRHLTYPVIGPSRLQEKEIVWDDHVAQNLRILSRNQVPFIENKSDLSISFPGGGKFTVDGGDNIESLRGKSDWGGIGLDEFAYWKDPQYAWEEVIEPNLIVNHAFAIIFSTTNGYDYFHRMAKRGDHLNEIEGTAFNDDGEIVPANEWYKTYRYTSYDNPFLDKNWLESKKLTMSTEAFNREYLAKFERFQGLIYKEFDRRINIKDFEVSLGWTFYRAMDFGASNATVCLWLGVDNADNVYLFDEYYNNNLPAQSHANIINGKTSPEHPVKLTFCDPSGKQAVLDYANLNLILTPAVKVYTGEQDWVNSGIEKVKQALKVNPQSGQPRLFVHPRCINTIREFESYHWEESKSTGIVKDIPHKEDDHCMDALRYFMVSYSQPSIDYDLPARQFTNEYTGYSSVSYE